MCSEPISAWSLYPPPFSNCPTSLCNFTQKLLEFVHWGFGKYLTARSSKNV